MSQAPDPALAEAIKLLRQKRGFSQEALAGAASISTSSVSRIERATMSPQWALVRQLAEILGLSIAELASAVEAAESG